MTAGKNIQADKQAAILAESAFGHYHRTLHEFLLRRLTHSQDASDALQEVFLRLLRLERSELVRNPQAYLYGIASHVVREFRVRARRERERMTFDSRTVEDHSEHPLHIAPDELAKSIGVERQVEKALGKLTPVELKILLYERRDGLSLEEIAQKMGLSVHTVKKYLFRALASVRTSLNRYDQPD